MAADDLAGAAFDRLVTSFALPDDQVDSGIAKALAALGQDLGIGERHDELLMTSARTPTVGRLDASAGERMRRRADAPLSHQPDVVVGTLREADSDRRTAPLHTATGETAGVDFSAEQAELWQPYLSGTTSGSLRRPLLQTPS